jgi:hypothetical protein
VLLSYSRFLSLHVKIRLICSDSTVTNAQDYFFGALVMNKKCFITLKPEVNTSMLEIKPEAGKIVFYGTFFNPWSSIVEGNEVASLGWYEAL